MGFIWEIFKMRFYVNTKEAKTERPHIHVAKGRGRTNDLKIWLDADTIRLGGMKGEFDARDVKDALKAAKANRARFVEEYEKVHGKGAGRKAKK